MAEFVPGLELARGFYEDAVAPLVADVPHSAARLGWGSDALGFDTSRSTDHGWGPRLQLFVEAADVPSVDARLDTDLPERYRGWPVRFGWDSTPVMKHVEVIDLGDWLRERLGFDPRATPSYRDWLAAPQQLLLEVTAGAVFHDGLSQLEPIRGTLRWYPDELWLWLLACQWRRIDQEEPFVGRTAEVEDDLGSRVLAARLVRDLIRLCFLLERRYAPYSSGLGRRSAGSTPSRNRSAAICYLYVHERQRGRCGASPEPQPLSASRRARRAAPRHGPEPAGRGARAAPKRGRCARSADRRGTCVEARPPRVAGAAPTRRGSVRAQPRARRDPRRALSLALFYADASAIVKLVRDEPESDTLRAFLADADLVSCELLVTEVPRAIRRAVANDPRLPLDDLIVRAGEILDTLALLPLDRALLIGAGALAEPALRTLDAIHVIAAADLAPLDAFVSYDERQAAAARLAGLRTVSPGA